VTHLAHVRFCLQNFRFDRFLAANGIYGYILSLLTYISYLCYDVKKVAAVHSGPCHSQAAFSSEMLHKAKSVTRLALAAETSGAGDH